MKEVKIKLLNENSKVPTKAIYNDACYDVVATSRKDYGDGRIEYGLGISFELYENTQLDVRARSSIHKTGLILSNCIGTGDEGYRGEYKVVFYHVIPSLPPYEVGDRVAQIQIKSREDVSFVVAEELSESVRGEGGWGHSGLKELDTKTRDLVQDIVALGIYNSSDILQQFQECQAVALDEHEEWLKDLDELRKEEVLEFISNEFPDMSPDEAISSIQKQLVAEVKLKDRRFILPNVDVPVSEILEAYEQSNPNSVKVANNNSLTSRKLTI